MFVADLHNDLLQRAILGEDIINESKNGHTDIARLISGKINFEVFAIWITKQYLEHSAFIRANELIDKLEEVEKKTKNFFVFKSNQKISSKIKNNSLLGAIGLEGGECLEENIDKLQHFIDRGIFYLGPTWNYSTSLASSAYDETYNAKKLKSIGLTNFGKDSIKLCEENGVIIDVSHIGEKSFWDIISLSKMPIIASHSNAYSLCKHFRNLKDEQILAIKKTQGVIFANLYPGFIDINFAKREKRLKLSLKKELDKIDLNYSDPDKRWIKKQYYLQKKLYSITPKLEEFVDHIEYIIKLAGIDYTGVGSDYDGTDCLPKGIFDCRDHMLISRELKKRGYSKIDVEKVMGLNLIRVRELNESI